MTLTPTQVTNLVCFLNELNDYLLPRADASMEPGEETYTGNWEMRTLMELEALRATLPEELQ